jgi:histone H2B
VSTSNTLWTPLFARTRTHIHIRTMVDDKKKIFEDTEDVDDEDVDDEDEVDDDEDEDDEDDDEEDDDDGDDVSQMDVDDANGQTLSSLAAAAAAATTTKKAKGRSRNTRKMPNYKGYIYRVLKELHPTVSIGTEGIITMNDIVNTFLESLVANIVVLAKHNSGRWKTVTEKIVISAVKLTLHGELGKHAIVEGLKAVAKFEASCA